MALSLSRYLKMLTALLVCLFFCSATHVGPPCEVKAYKAFDKLGYRLADRYGLCFLNSGIGSHLVGSDKCLWALHLMGRQKLTIEEARPIASAIAQALIMNMYRDPVYTNAQNEFTRGKNPASRPLNNDLMGFRLTFWDENMDRPLKPYVAQIRLSDSKLYYYYADSSTQALEKPIIESFQWDSLPGN
jgi:hypothetical protein